MQDFTTTGVTTTTSNTRLKPSLYKTIFMSFITVIIICGFVITTIIPIYAFQQFDAKTRYYRESVPAEKTFTGIKSVYSPAADSGWVNPNVIYPQLPLSSRFILDINGCLSRALRSEINDFFEPNFHTRVSLCVGNNNSFTTYISPAAVNNSRVDRPYLIDIRKFRSNERGNILPTRKGIHLDFSELDSLYNLLPWIDAWMMLKVANGERGRIFRIPVTESSSSTVTTTSFVNNNSLPTDLTSAAAFHHDNRRRNVEGYGGGLDGGGDGGDSR